MQTLYEHDFYAWSQEQAKILMSGNLEELDIEHVHEELLSMGASEKRELESRLGTLLMHLLKWKYQPEKRMIGFSWKYTIIDQRRKLKKLLREMPSLKSKLYLELGDIYIDGIVEAVKETDLKESTFPEICPWTIEQILDNEFYPNE